MVKNHHHGPRWGLVAAASLLALSVAACTDAGQRLARERMLDHAAYHGDDLFALTELLAKNWVAAEARLNQTRVEMGDYPPVLYNLAYLYRMTGRADQAEALYREILASGSDPMIYPPDSRPLRSKVLARQALAGMDRR